MASDVDIVNLALASLGDAARVTSINPPDQSAQAGLASRFFPVARDALLEMHTWGFATVREPLAYVTNPSSTWKYAYAAPSNVLNYIAVLDPLAADDYSMGVQLPNTVLGSIQAGVGVYQPQPFTVETIASTTIILTNQQDAVLRYTKGITDTAEFSPLFVVGLSKLLASYLAGPLIKGQEGRNVAASMLQEFMKWKELAVESDSNQRKLNITPGAPWMVNR